MNQEGIKEKRLSCPSLLSFSRPVTLFSDTTWKCRRTGGGEKKPFRTGPGSLQRGKGITFIKVQKLEYFNDDFTCLRVYDFIVQL